MDEPDKKQAEAPKPETPKPVKAKKSVEYYEASQWVLMRRRFSKHKVAVWMLYVVILLYVLCLNCDFFAPYEPAEIHKHWVNLPPQMLRFGFVEGSWLPGFYVHPFVKEQNPVTLRRRYRVDTTKRVPIRLFARERTWTFLWLFETDVHLFGVNPETVLATGSDGGPVTATIADDPDTEGMQYRVVTVRNTDLAKADIRNGDTLILHGTPGEGQEEQSGEFEVVGVDYEQGTIMLKLGPKAAVTEPARIEVVRTYTAFLLGTGALGQDILSRMLYGGRISLLLGLTGVLLTFFLGITLGGISGYYGGKIDMLIQRLAEILQTVPKIPIWLAMAAAIPKEWTSLQVYFAMTLILACMGWTGLCRVVRGKLLALREEDYARAALLAGATERRVIFAHLIPNFLSHIIASLTLSIPGMILAETSLSFLGLGLRPPMVSWGVLLQEGQTPHNVINQPWLLLPAGMVILAVLAFNFVGEGLRDAADPYSV